MCRSEAWEIPLRIRQDIGDGRWQDRVVAPSVGTKEPGGVAGAAGAGTVDAGRVFICEADPGEGCPVKGAR